MKAHTSEFKNQIKTMGRELDSKITYTLNGVNIELGKEQLNSITPTYQGALLKSVMKELDIDSNVYIPEKTILNYQFGLKVNGKYEYINYGNYVVYKTEKQEDTNSYKLICYDKMLYTMIDYTPLDITYPINLREYINAIATKCGLEFANIVGTFANYDTPINKDNFRNGNYTFRDVLDYVAELVGGWLCINDNDELEIRYPELAKNYDKVSGENVSFISNVEDEINTIIVDGKSTQATRSGKNLLNNIASTTTIYGVTFTKNEDGSVICNGTATNTVNTYKIATTTLQPGTYTLSGCPSGGSTSTFRITELKGAPDDIGSGKTFTVSQETTYNWYIQIYNGNVCNNLIFKPMLRLSSITDDTYEPYGVSPSPDYPSEIESVGYENLFNINTAALNSALKWADGTYYTENLSVASDFIKIEKGKSYISKYKMQIILFNENKEYIGYYNDTSSQYNSFTISTDSECNYVKVSFRSRNNNNVDFTTIGDIQLEKGLETHSYIPYGKYGIEVKNTGKNLFDKNAQGLILGKILQRDGTIVNNGGYAISDYIPVRANKNYYQENFNSYYSCYYDKNKKYLGVCGTQKFTPSQDGYIRTSLLKINLDIAQITQNTVATDYEPYQENTSLFVLDQPLRSLPNGVKDKLYVQNNILYVDRKVGSKVFDGSEDWILYGKIGAVERRFGLRDKKVPQDLVMVSNYFKCGSKAIGELTDLMFWTQDEYWVITDINSKWVDATEFKTWLSTHNTQVDYELATPYTETIGEVEIPSAFKGNNNITLSANINTNIDITYTKEYEEVDREFLKDVNVSFSKKYGPVNSIVFSRGGGSDNIYRKDYDSISANGLTEIKITDNPFLEDDERENFIQSVFDKLNGLEFYIMDVASTGITYLELGDLYYFNMSEDKPSLKTGLVQAGLRKAQGSSLGKYICLMLNDKIDITQGLSESIYVDEPDITETDYKTASITDKSIKNAIIQTNKNSAEILLKVNSNEVVSAINLSPEKIKIQSSKIDVDGVLSVLGKAGSTVINGANITTGSINCDRLNGGTINGQAIRGGSISITTGNYYFNMGTSTSNPNCSGLNVGNYGVKAHSDITATGFAITDSDTGKSESFGIKDYHGHVHYLTFTGGILTKWEYK